MKRSKKPGKSSPGQSQRDEDQLRDEIFEYVVRYKQQNDGNSPPLIDIARAFMISPSTARYHLFMLQGEQRIQRFGRRGIVINGGEWNYHRPMI